MKILFVVDSFSGGAGNVIQLLAQAFRDKKYDVLLLLLNGRRVKSKYDLSGIEVVDCPLGQYAKGYTPLDRIIKSVRVIRKQFDRIQPDAVISFLTELNILCCMANKKKFPLIISERNDPAKDNIKKYWKMLRNKYYHRADRIIVQCSNFIDFAGGRFTEKCMVIPNPIIKPTIRKDLAEIHSPVKLVSLGRLNRQKNFKWMIESMELLQKNDDDFTLSIYGAGSEEDELRAFIEQRQLQKKVFLKGYAVDTYSVLAESDIYLMTSDYEGFPNALSEAMAVGLPSVSRLCHKGLKDLVDDEHNGFLITPDDMSGFVDKIIKLKSDTSLYRRVGNNAKNVSDTFSIDRIVSLWEEEIQKLFIK